MTAPLRSMVPTAMINRTVAVATALIITVVSRSA
jgi:hypothetical protein